MISSNSFIIVFFLFLAVVLPGANTDPPSEPSKATTKAGNTNPLTPAPTQKDGAGNTAAGTTPKPNNVSSTWNTTSSGGDGSRFSIMENKGMLMRSFFVFLGITSIVVIYFGVKAWRTRRRKSKSRKYGLITSRGADLEMEPLDQDMDDDDDMTVFEVNGRQK